MVDKNIPDIRIGDLVEYDPDATDSPSFKEDFESYNTRDGPFLVYSIETTGRATAPRIVVHFLEQKTGNYESDYIQYFKVIAR